MGGGGVGEGREVEVTGCLPFSCTVERDGLPGGLDEGEGGGGGVCVCVCVCVCYTCTYEYS